MKLKKLYEGRFREGDVVIPNVGPHKGVKHTIIYDFGDGRYNIQPMGLRPNQIKYALGAAGASEDQLKKVGSTPQKPAPSIIDTSDLPAGKSPFREKKSSKLKDILNKKQINEVDYSTMKLKSNIDQKWDSAKTMQNDLSQWIESTYAATGNVGDILKALEQVLTRTKNVSKEAPSQVPSFSDFKKGKRF